jgi:hypothetical protein
MIRGPTTVAGVVFVDELVELGLQTPIFVRLSDQNAQSSRLLEVEPDTASTTVNHSVDLTGNITGSAVGSH